MKEIIEKIGGRDRLKNIIDACNSVLSALDGTNEEVSKNDVTSMVRLWDDLNDRDAPPEAVLSLAKFALAVLDAQEKHAPPIANYPVIPGGWKLVPLEATADMMDASWKIHGIYHPSAYRTMIAAAPSPGGYGG